MLFSINMFSAPLLLDSYAESYYFRSFCGKEHSLNIEFFHEVMSVCFVNTAISLSLYFFNWYGDRRKHWINFFLRWIKKLIPIINSRRESNFQSWNYHDNSQKECLITKNVLIICDCHILHNSSVKWNKPMN